MKYYIEQIYHVWEGYLRKIPVERPNIYRILFGTHATTCMQISTGQKKTHTEFVLQCVIFNFLIVFGIKIIKSPRTPKRKVDISSTFNGIFHQLELYSWKIYETSCLLYKTALKQGGGINGYIIIFFVHVYCD